jgi:hypothetical protein
MPVKLTTTIKKIASIPNSTNSTLLSEFCQYMKSNGASESHQNNNLKALISFAHFLAKLIGEVHGLDFAPIKFEVAEDLDYWSAEIPGKVLAKAEALTGPMTPPGKRVQTLNPPGSEVGPGAIATWGKSTADEADAMGFKWERKGKSSKHISFDWDGP